MAFILSAKSSSLYRDRFFNKRSFWYSTFSINSSFDNSELGSFFFKISKHSVIISVPPISGKSRQSRGIVVLTLGLIFGFSFNSTLGLLEATLGLLRGFSLDVTL